MQPTAPRHSNVKLIATIAAVIVIAGIVVLADHLKSKNTAATTAITTPATNQTAQPSVSDQTTSASSGTASSASTTSSSSYKDGTYTASSDYYVPHGYENIQVSLTIKNGVITGSSIKNTESDRDSAAYQEDFASQYKNYVIGKSVSGLKLDIIAGASDTTQGFNDALSQIATKAQA